MVPEYSTTLLKYKIYEISKNFDIFLAYFPYFGEIKTYL
jgi:hypothetical protein